MQIDLYKMVAVVLSMCVAELVVHSESKCVHYSFFPSYLSMPF